MTREVCLRVTHSLILALIPALLAGCGSDGNRACVPGISVACPCSDGRTGAQSCNPSGSGYGVCECTAPGTGGAAGGGGQPAGGTGGTGTSATGGVGGAHPFGGAAGAGAAGTPGQAGSAGGGGASGGAAGSAGNGGVGGATGKGGSGAGGAAASGVAGVGGSGTATGGTAGSAGGGSESGLFALAAVYGRAVSTNNTVPTVADVDGDHVVDLVAAPFPMNERSPGAQDSISVWKGRGDGTFAPGAIVTTFTEPSQFQGVSIADFDGDGRADADISTASSQTYAFGQSDGTFVMGASWGGPASNLHNCGVGPFAGPGSWGTFYAGLDSGGAIDYSVATVKGLPNSSVNYAGPTSLDVSVGANGYVQCLGWGDVAGDGESEYGLLGVGAPSPTRPLRSRSFPGRAPLASNRP